MAGRTRGIAREVVGQAVTVLYKNSNF